MENNPAILEVAMEIALPIETLNEIAQRFGPEKARQCAMSTSVGGIGPLLRERITQQSEAGVNVVGVTLMYDSVWLQVWHEWGQITLQKINVGRELRQILKPTDLGFQLTFFDGKTTDVEVWELAYGQTKIYFLSAPAITEVVYPGPKDMPAGTTNPYAWAHEIRLKQSWLVGRGALLLSKKLNRQPDIAILSETPTVFVHNRLVKDDLQNDPFFAQTKYIFNDHTPLEYAHPIWDLHTIELAKLDSSLYLKSPAWNAQRKTLDVTSHLVGCSEGVYGVAKKHGEVMKAMPSLKDFSGKIKYVTNGVRQKDWQAPEFLNPDSLSDQQLIEIKQNKKKALLNWAWRHCRLWPTWANESLSRKIIIWTRRITPYKRLDILVKLLKNPEYRERFLQLNIIILVGGRIHQQDNHAQDIVYDLLDLLEKDKELEPRIVTIDNFNVWEAPLLFQGADASMMVADDTREASATGFMKTLMNGGAVVATADGAVPEFVIFQTGAAPHETEASKPENANTNPPNRHPNGFLIPYINGEPTPLGLLEALEAFNKSFQNPEEAAAIMRAALATTPEVSVARTVDQMKMLYEEVLHSPSLLPQT